MSKWSLFVAMAMAATVACGGGGGTEEGFEAEAEAEAEADGSAEGEAEAEAESESEGEAEAEGDCGGAGCGRGGEGEAEAEGEGEDPFRPALGCTPPAMRRATGEPFVEVAAEVGLGSLTSNTEAVCLLDRDGDGDLDLVVTTNGDLRFFDNGGLGTFVDMTAAVGLSGPVWGLRPKCLAFDADGDGDPDLLIPSDGMTMFAENRGGTFVATGLSGGMGESTAACDIDGDGDLDAVTSSIDGDNTRLFVNNGTSFMEEGVERGLSPWADSKNSVRCLDLNGDQRPEIVLAGESALVVYLNRGDGTFIDDTGGFGMLAAAVNGIAAADYDLDGVPDVALGGTARRSAFFDCDDARCREVSREVGLGDPAEKEPPRGVCAEDFDQDGLPDLFFTRRGLQELYWNNGGTFDQYDGGGSVFSALRYSRGTACGDIDGDGDVDLVVGDSSGTLAVYENRVATGSWLIVRLDGRGTTPNGAVVTVMASGGCSYAKEYSTGGSFEATDSPWLHFGLGTATSVRVRVRWPDGTETTQDSAVNRMVSIVR